MVVDRNRSRSPRGNGTADDVSRLVVAREQARLAKDWGLADEIRNQLAGLGVTVYDKTSTWKSADGRTGRIPTFSEIEAGHSGENLQVNTGIVGNIGDSAEVAQIKQLIQMREQARAAKDFASSDSIRDQLKGLGVEMFDKEKVWRSKSGAAGCIIGFRGDAGPTDMEITTLVVQREKARQAGDWSTGDMIRNELKSVGVDIYDKEKNWRAKDGRIGAIPSWTEIVNGGGAVAPQASAVPMLQVVGQGSVADLRNQIVQAALAAASNPTSAVRTLQLLQSASPVPQMVHTGGVRATPKAAVHAPAVVKVEKLPEVQEALAFITQVGTGGALVGEAEIAWLVETREKARMQKDFASSDELRNALRNSLGVELLEKEKRWQTNDGRSGLIPMWSNLVS